MNNKGRNHVHSRKPLGMSVPNRINKIIIKKESFLPLTELDATTTQRRSTVTPRMRFQMEKETKQRDWRNNANKSFTEMDEHWQMKDNVRSQVVQRNAKIMNETMKKSRSGQVEASPNEKK
jgi:hypothetical protein